MVREYPALVITDVRDLSKNSGNPAFAHPKGLICALINLPLVLGYFIAHYFYNRIYL